MITISNRWTGKDGKTRWQIHRRLDENDPYYNSRKKLSKDDPFWCDPFDDADKIADYCKTKFSWSSGIRITHNGKVLREEIW